MNKAITVKVNLLFSLIYLSLIFSVHAQSYDPRLFKSIEWRMIGPYRGGRTVGACGIRQQPNVFYIGVNNGGIWKTTDYGRTWQPIFDDQPTGSIGDVAVAPSNPEIIYAASGEGIQRPDLSVGNGMYKSTDGGKKWTHLGVKDAQQIGGIAVDPANENRVFAAVLGHPYGPNMERGIFRTTDGGKNWDKVLFLDENTGAIQVAIDPSNTDIIYADLFASRQGPWENGEWQGAGSGMYKSTDGGTTWRKLTNGLPTFQQGLGRIGFCIAPTDHNRLYATVDAHKEVAGIYRSDDGGESWNKLNGDERLWGRGDDFAELKVDPKNADIVYDANVVLWKSIDGGKTWKGFHGAPGGDDSHRLWINPDNPDIILLAGDQGAMITVNGGDTWSSWYNQPTAQLYHVSADNDFPYNVYSGQQESGSVGIASRGNDGGITFRDWRPVGAEEYGYVVADPLDHNIVYGGKISKYDKRTGQFQDISPDAARSGKYRFIRTAPILFSPTDPKTLFFAGNVLFKTRDGGNNWQVISPDLTRTTYDVPANIGIYRNDAMKTMPRRGVIYTIAPSPADSNIIWIGTDDGLIQITHDGGKNWENVTPAEITSWSKISIIEASHSDVNIAYAAVNRIRLDDMRPHIFKTTDGGRSWKEIVTGLPDDPVNVVREDPLKKGLLFAGSETAAYVSFDDGGHWQSLRLNMPATSIRDLLIKDNDIVVATHGRSFWILDNINLLRQFSDSTISQQAILFKTGDTYRVRWNLYPDTPLPPEEPTGQNPPDGAIIDYFLKEKSTSEVTLDILDESGNMIRHYSSHDTLYKIPDVNIPLYWIRPQQILSADRGSHRFLWDMHYPPLNVPPSYPISAVYGNTAPEPTSPWVMPGVYTVKLKVNGKIFSQPLTIKMDPRVKTSSAQLQQQHDLSLTMYQDRKQVLIVLNEIKKLENSIQNVLPQTSGQAKKLLVQLQNELLNLKIQSKSTSLSSLNATLEVLFPNLQSNDMPLTSQAIAAAGQTHLQYEQLSQKWNELKSNVNELNKQLQKKGLSMVIF